MAQLRGCLTCFIEVERIALADGSAVLFCATCDMIGGESDVIAGGPVWAAGMGAPKHLRAVKTAPKPRAAAGERIGSRTLRRAG